MATKENKAKANVSKSSWLDDLRSLFSMLTAWAHENDWTIREITKTMKSEELGKYQAPCLILQKETVKIMAEPISHRSPGTHGVVDLYLMPAYDDIASLFLKQGEWKLHYVHDDEEIKLNGAVDSMLQATSRKLTKKNLLNVLDSMVAHAA
jgi:hypothetical protein